MVFWLIFIFVVGYLAIAFEHPIGINKAAPALVTGVLCWVVLILNQQDTESINHHLLNHMGEISGILFFLMGAMVIVELMDAHDSFQIITDRIKTKRKSRLMWIVAILTFVLSAILDNLTTSIVMISLVRKLVDEAKTRLWFAALIVIAANAGGAWSPLGDVTTTMLWIGGQITAWNIMITLIMPSLFCLLFPAWIVSRKMKGVFKIPEKQNGTGNIPSTEKERNAVFVIGILCLLFVPVFKTLTHLPPFMGILIGLGVMWIITERIHKGKDMADKDSLSVVTALRKIDTSGILFFLGILLCISALETSGLLTGFAAELRSLLQTDTRIAMALGLLSSIIDNVPLVAATQAMYGLDMYPTDHFFWEFLAFTTGTGGSVLIIGSAAGIAAMGLEKISFIWYLKNISWLALAGFLAGSLVYIVQYAVFHG